MPPPSPSTLNPQPSTPSPRDDAVAIWQAGVAAVDSAKLVRDAVRVGGGAVHLAGESVPLAEIDRVVAVGAGKAGAGMAAGLEAALAGTGLPLTGWVNVPADCVRESDRIRLHAARPAGVNEPRPEGVAGTRRILDLVRSLGPRDLCVVLLSGGGSALLVAPADGVTLADKGAVTRLLASRGAAIDELNTVRKHLSAVKGGGLARACTAGHAAALVVSDVIGDPPDVIASGPTVRGTSTPIDALAVLRRFAPDRADVPDAVWETLRAAADRVAGSVGGGMRTAIIGSNRTAVEAALLDAAARGYVLVNDGEPRGGEAAGEGRRLLARARELRDRVDPARRLCFLSGGEPTVTLAETDAPRKGGRNQELVLAALAATWDEGLGDAVILSGGTDGEDGPTDAAGAIADQSVIDRARALGLDPRDFLAVNNSHPFFEATGGLLKTGPTHTNVMDLRVLILP